MSRNGEKWKKPFRKKNQIISLDVGKTPKYEKWKSSFWKKNRIIFPKCWKSYKTGKQENCVSKEWKDFIVLKLDGKNSCFEHLKRFQRSERSEKWNVLEGSKENIISSDWNVYKGSKREDHFETKVRF